MPNIEQLSTNELTDLLLNTGYMETYINTNDREPSWDGNIYMYNDYCKLNESHKKEDLIGRIPVQVKGTLVKSLSNTKIRTNYKVELSDLRNYLNDGGVIYFVIEVLQSNNKNAGILKKKIFYKVLAPCDIEQILTKHNNKRKHSIEFKLFPQDANKINTIVRNSIETCRRQHSSNGKCISPALIDLKHDKLHIHVFEYDKSKFFLETLFENGIHAYCVKPGGFELPLFNFENLTSIEGKTTADVCFLNRHIVLDLNFKKTNSEFTIEVGKIITMKKDNEKLNISFHPSGRIEEDVFYTDMILYLSEATDKFILINDFKLDIQNELFATMDIDYIVAYNRNLYNIHNYVKDLKLNFDVTLNNSEDLALAIILNECTNNNKQISEQTLRKLLSTELYASLKKNETLFVKQNFHDTKILICITKISSKRYLILDPFSKKYTFRNKRKQIISVFDMIGLNDYCEASNIRINEIVNSYQALPISKKLFNFAIQTLLNLLGAYDYFNEQEFSSYKYVCYKNTLLSTAKELASWIYENNCDKDFALKSYINLLQTIRRERPFREEEKEQIKDMIDDKASGNDEKFALYLLLDDQKHAQRLFATLKQEEQDFYKTMPIYHFAHFQKSEQGQAIPNENNDLDSLTSQVTSNL